MKDTQILFSGPMALATLDETKSQTRRPVKCAIEIAAIGSAEQWNRAKAHPSMLTPDVVLLDTAGRPFTIPCPYGRRGDRLWGRETFYAWGRWETRFSAKKGRDEWHFVDMTLDGPGRYFYAADGSAQSLGLVDHRATGVVGWWTRPAIFMPRAASRIRLEVTGVRVERLQDISEADAIAEGIRRPESMSDEAMLDADVWPTGVERAAFNALNQPVAQYRRLWEQLNGTGTWAANPLVWVVEFRRIDSR